MNKMKSLSDSSTSESEDDANKHSKNAASYQPWSSTKRKISTDDTEDERLDAVGWTSNRIAKSHSSDSAQEDHQNESYYTESRPSLSFKKPMNYTDRCFSPDDTEDEHSEASEPSSKRINNELDSDYIERQLLADHTDSESDDKNIYESPNETPSNLPTVEKLNENYGIGAKLLEKMGYKKGTGLGKYSQGRVDIVEASKQRGRRGLGMQLKNFKQNSEPWDFDADPVSLNEDVLWIPQSDLEPLEMKTLRTWMVEGKKKEIIDDETEFCDSDILKKVIAYKSVFDELKGGELRSARSKSNPFETIRGGLFLNRAAMKMANMDAVFKFMFTNPKNEKGKSAIGPHELLYFADVCAGPGGFSEYVLWRKRWECKGFGFTLKGQNDFKLCDFFSGPPETFEPYYGIKEDGDIYSPENLKSFKEFVLSNTDRKGVHFMMADGGFSVEGQENIQEVLSKRLYLCQFLCALRILRTGGHFVCKLFDIFTPFSVGLIYLMYNAFEGICIFKPNTSRPANSERYIICKSLKENVKDISDYLYEINCNLNSYSTDSKLDIIEIVPLHILQGNKTFYDYIFESNNVIGARQIIFLDKVRAFVQNTALEDHRQTDLRTECFKLWQVPDILRSAPARCDPADRFKQLMAGKSLSYLDTASTPLVLSNLRALENIFDFHCVVNGTTAPCLFLGTGKSNIFHYTEQKSWVKLESCSLELPADTIFYGEIVNELKGESRGQRKIQCLHLIDAIFIGGKDVRKLHYEERMLIAQKLAKAVNKPSIKSCTLLRVKKVWSLSKINDVFNHLSMKINKGNPHPTLCYNLDDERHIIPSNMLIFKTTSDPWITAYSKTHQQTYFFNTKQNISKFEKYVAIADFETCFKKRFLWSWDRGVQLIQAQQKSENDSVLQGNVLRDFINKRLKIITGKI